MAANPLLKDKPADVATINPDKVVLTVLDEPYKVINYTDKKTGERVEAYIQSCDIKLPNDRHPKEYENFVSERADLLPAGDYTANLAGSVYMQGKKVAIGRLKWMPA